MKKVLTFILTLATASLAGAQSSQPQRPSEVRVAMQPDAWEVDPDRVAFITHRSVPAVQGLDNGALMHLKELDFENGTIEFDIELPSGASLASGFANRTTTLPEKIFISVPSGPSIRATVRSSSTLRWSTA